MKVLTERNGTFSPFGQMLFFDDGSSEFDPECTQTTPILTAERYNGKAAKNDAGEWVAAPGARVHDWTMDNLVGFHVGLTMIGGTSDGKHIYDYTVITPTGAAFHGDGKHNALVVPPGWDTVRVAAEAIAWMCVGPDDSIETPELNEAQSTWYYSFDREGANADIADWLEKYDRGEWELTEEATDPKVWKPPTGKQLDEMAEDYVRNYIYGNQSGLITHLLSADDGYLSWEDITNLYPDAYSMSADELAAAIDDHDGKGDAWKDLVCEDGLHAAGDEIAQDDLELADLNSDDIDILRDYVRDRLEPNEIYEWWLVDEWLADRLEEIGEPTLSDGMSHWWGRTCTGQMIKMDGTLQKIAARYLNFD